jgi:hypothetical protein
MSSTTLVTLVHGVVAVVIATAATVLLALHDIDSTAALALFGASLALVGGATNTLLALRVPAPGQTVQPPAPPQ